MDAKIESYSADGGYDSFDAHADIGGDVHAPMEDKLKFLYEIGRREQVGMYLRNQK